MKSISAKTRSERRLAARKQVHRVKRSLCKQVQAWAYESRHQRKVRAEWRLNRRCPLWIRNFDHLVCVFKGYRVIVEKRGIEWFVSGLPNGISRTFQTRNEAMNYAEAVLCIS